MRFESDEELQNKHAFLRKGERASIHDVESAESRLLDNSADLDSRIFVIGFYSMEYKRYRTQLARHCEYLICNYPTSFWATYVDWPNNAPELPLLFEIWQTQMKLHPTNTMILYNAATFCKSWNKRQSIALFEKGFKIEPRCALWTFQLASLHVSMMQDSPAPRECFAKAMECFDKALSLPRRYLSPGDFYSPALLDQLLLDYAQTALREGFYVEATRYGMKNLVRLKRRLAKQPDAFSYFQDYLISTHLVLERSYTALGKKELAEKHKSSTERLQTNSLLS